MKPNKTKTKRVKYAVISTEAINFDPSRFDREFRDILKKNEIGGIEIIKEEGNFHHLIKFKLYPLNKE